MSEGWPPRLDESWIAETETRLAVGWWTPDAVARALTEASRLPPERVQAIMSAALRNREAAMSKWPAVTDCDRLDAAFSRLNAQGIVARHCWHLNDIEGAREMASFVESSAHGADGYVFYSFDALLSTVSRGIPLRLTSLATDGWSWFSHEPPPTTFVSVQRHIENALTQCGLSISQEGFGIGVKMQWHRRAAPRSEFGGASNFDPMEVSW